MQIDRYEGLNELFGCSAVIFLHVTLQNTLTYIHQQFVSFWISIKRLLVGWFSFV